MEAHLLLGEEEEGGRKGRLYAPAKVKSVEWQGGKDEGDFNISPLVKAKNKNIRVL